MKPMIALTRSEGVRAPHFLHRRLALAVVVLAGVLAAGCDPVDADFFPLNEGNEWLYEWSKSAPAAATKPQSSDRVGMWQVNEDPSAVWVREGATPWVASVKMALALKHVSGDDCLTYAGAYRPGGVAKISKLNGVLSVQTQTSQLELLPMQLDLPLLTWPVFAGAKWEDHGAQQLGVSAVAMCRLVGFETVQVPAGRFFECAHVVRVLDPALEGLEARLYRVQHFWLAPEIGLVKLLYENDLGPVLRGELRAFHLNPLSAEVAAAQQAKLELTMDPANMVLPGSGGGGEALTPAEMHRRLLYTTGDDYRR